MSKKTSVYEISESDEVIALIITPSFAKMLRDNINNSPDILLFIAAFDYSKRTGQYLSGVTEGYPDSFITNIQSHNAHV